MADPLSVTASITGIISLGLTVSSGLVKFVQSARDAPKELETIANDMFALCGILDQFKGLITSGGGNLNLVLADDAAKNCNILFSSMKDELEKASSTIRLTTLSGGKVKLSLKERGRFFFRQDSLTKLKTDILQSKTTLMLAMVVADIKKREEAQRNPERDEGAAEERLQMLATMQSLNRKLEDMKVQTPEKSSNILPPKRIMRNVNVDNEAKNRASPPLPSRAISNQANQTLSLGPNSHVAMALANSKKRKEAQRNPERDEAKNPAPPPLPSRAISNQANAGVFLDSNTHKPNVFTNMVAADPFTPLNNNTPVYGKKGLNNQTDDIPEPSPHHRHIQAWTMELDRESYEQSGWLRHNIKSAALPAGSPENQVREGSHRQVKAEDTLKMLNTPQRELVLAHASRSGSELQLVEECSSVRLATVFGNLDLKMLRWTSCRNQIGRLSSHAYRRPQPERQTLPPLMSPYHLPTPDTHRPIETPNTDHTMDAPAMAAAAAIPRDHAGFLERPPPARPRKAPTYQDPYGYNYVADRTLEKGKVTLNSSRRKEEQLPLKPYGMASGGPRSPGIFGMPIPAPTLEATGPPQAGSPSPLADSPGLKKTWSHRREQRDDVEFHRAMTYRRSTGTDRRRRSIGITGTACRQVDTQWGEIDDVVVDIGEAEVLLAQLAAKWTLGGAASEEAKGCV